jgi:hypothetical protein
MMMSSDCVRSAFGYAVLVGARNTSSVRVKERPSSEIATRPSAAVQTAPTSTTGQ